MDGTGARTSGGRAMVGALSAIDPTFARTGSGSARPGSAGPVARG